VLADLPYLFAHGQGEADFHREDPVARQPPGREYDARGDGRAEDLKQRGRRRADVSTLGAAGTLRLRFARRHDVVRHEGQPKTCDDAEDGDEFLDYPEFL